MNSSLTIRSTVRQSSIRSVKHLTLLGGTYGYVWNGCSGSESYRADNMAGLTRTAMREAARRDPKVAESVRFYEERRSEELYDLQADPSGLHDLSASSVHPQCMLRS